MGAGEGARELFAWAAFSWHVFEGLSGSPTKHTGTVKVPALGENDLRELSTR